MGSSALVDDQSFDGAFISNNLGKITTRGYNPILLQVLLRSIVGKLYFQKIQSQTAQPKVSDKDIHNFVLPLLDQSVVGAIEHNYLEAHRSKKRSHGLLIIAKQGVEMAIEKNEDEATRWIGRALEGLNKDH